MFNLVQRACVRVVRCQARVPSVAASLLTRPPTPQQTQSRNMSSQQHKLDLSGVFPPITTPFDDNENIDWPKLKHNMDIWETAGLSGYVVQGSNGEYTYLTQTERVDMVKRVRAMLPEKRLIIAGSGCESTRDTVSMTHQMAEAGADAALVVTPCFYKGRMTGSALKEHFTKVADSSPVPIILYSVPANTGIDLDVQIVSALASHPNIIGLKDSGGDISKITNVVYQTSGQDFQVLAGSASFLYTALSVGCVGGVCALANVLPKETVELQNLFKAGSLNEAKALQHRLVAPNTAVTRQFGVSGLKKSMEWFGFYGGPTRSPLQPLTPQEEEAVRHAFTSTGFLPGSKL